MGGVENSHSRDFLLLVPLQKFGASGVVCARGAGFFYNTFCHRSDDSPRGDEDIPPSTRHSSHLLVFSRAAPMSSPPFTAAPVSVQILDKKNSPSLIPRQAPSSRTV